MFCDQVVLTVQAGRGGDGCMSFRREKFVPRGGPDGGDGGRGGHIVLRVNSNLNSLIHLKKKPLYKAEAGVAGHRFDKAGKCAEDLVLEVPPGTLLYNNETDELIVDLVSEGDELVLLYGGKGGFGNAHFTSSIRQAPDFAEKGEPGEKMEVRFEMKMVADVGIIGIPSVGKSTLISRITDAKPKIADYPFTTLVPNMGVVNLSKWGGSKSETFVVADVPGLIEGAHQGKGLGDEFLRHVSRSAILLHVLDCQAQDMKNDYKVIINELKEYDPDLAKRPQIVVMNKIDTIDEETRELLMKDLKKVTKKVPLFMVSAVSGEELKPLVYQLWKEVQKFRKAEPDKEPVGHEGYRVFRPHLEKKRDTFEITIEGKKDHQIFVVKGKRIEQIVVMSDLENRAALMRVYDVMEKMSILKQIRKMDAELGDFIQIGKAKLEFRG